MSVEKSLIQFILDLLKDPKALAEFKEDPHGMLAQCGLSEVSADDVRDALVLAQDNDDVSFDRDYNTGGGHGGGHHHTPPPPPVHHGEDPVKYIDKYVTNNHYTYNVDDRDTIIDNSVNQNVDTGGGDFNQSIDTKTTVASGDGAVAVGGDNNAPVTTGDHNVVGDDNQVVSGDDNTSAFGSGSAYDTGDISADKGGAVSLGDNATGSNDASGSFNDTRTETNTTVDIDDSYNTDDSQYTETNTDDHSHTDVLSHNDANADLLSQT
ncbi:MAG: IniB N-terminal domain-containing protein [Actinomycetota bacterium]|uniref:IniB N-terminal domain-containing protein n=1 Tax=Pseudonocardia sp. UM4_GMWB1 TaxID=2212989 RepID=UPI00307EAFE7